MARLQVKLLVIAMALVAGTALMSSPAEALTKAEKAAWKQANVACKAQAKGKKLGWFARRRFVKGCLVQALKGYPNININIMMRGVTGKPLPVTHVDDYI
jgi:hypothetical protein